MKIEWTLSIGFPGATREGELEIEEDELEGLSEEAKEDYIAQLIYDYVNENYIAISWNIDE